MFIFDGKEHHITFKKNPLLDNFLIFGTCAINKINDFNYFLIDY